MKKLICQLVIYLKESITCGCNNLARRVFASLLQRPMIRCEHSSSLCCIMPFYKEVHLGPVRTIMNCACIRLISLGTQSKLLLQLPNTPQAFVFLLKYFTWKVKKCLD
jgi:hypothetical protein